MVGWMRGISLRTVRLHGGKERDCLLGLACGHFARGCWDLNEREEKLRLEGGD